MAEVVPIFDRLCQSYLDIGSAERDRIRSVLENRTHVRAVLLGYVYACANRICSPHDVRYLRWGLAAVSIENCAQDYRDVLLALAEIWVVAEQAGLEPSAHFVAVAGMSSKEKPRGGSTSVCEMLTDFHGYAVLAERRRSPDTHPKPRW